MTLHDWRLQKHSLISPFLRSFSAADDLNWKFGTLFLLLFWDALGPHLCPNTVSIVAKTRIKGSASSVPQSHRALSKIADGTTTTTTTSWSTVLQAVRQPLSSPPQRTTSFLATCVCALHFATANTGLTDWTTTCNELSRPSIFFLLETYLRQHCYLFTTTSTMNYYF